MENKVSWEMRALLTRSAILLGVLFKPLQGNSEQMYKKYFFNKILKNCFCFNIVYAYVSVYMYLVKNVLMQGTKHKAILFPLSPRFMNMFHYLMGKIRRM